MKEIQVSNGFVWNTEKQTKEGDYLVTIKDTILSDYDHGRYVHRAIFHEGRWKDSVGVNATWYKDEEIFAWIPMPELDDERWTYIPHYTEDTDWRKYLPEAGKRYLCIHESGWNPYVSKGVIIAHVNSKVNDWGRGDYDHKYYHYSHYMLLPEPYVGDISGT